MTKKEQAQASFLLREALRLENLRRSNGIATSINEDNFFTMLKAFFTSGGLK